MKFKNSFGYENISLNDANTKLLKYGISVCEDLSINWPKIPELQWTSTPVFDYSRDNEPILWTHKDFLRKMFLENDYTSVYEERHSILAIVDTIFKRIIWKSFKEYTNLIVMTPQDFDVFRKTQHNEMINRWVVWEFHWINLAGLILVEDSGWTNCFPLIFHELWHSLYENSEDSFLNEFRWMYFQILCTELLCLELLKLWIKASYPDDNPNIEWLSSFHKNAFLEAKVLHFQQSVHDLIVGQDPKAQEKQDKYLEMIRETKKSVKTLL